MITLYRFPYSCYALKVQLLLDVLALPYEVRDVPFGDRTELVKVTQGRVQVPAIVHKRENGSEKVVVESRDICRYLLGLKANNLVPKSAAGLIWAYCDWVDTTLEDPLFKMVSPEIADSFARDADRAMFIFIKERRYGTGCVSDWAQQKPRLVAQARDLLAESLLSIAHQGYLCGDHITLADIALVGHLAMVKYGRPELLPEIDPLIPGYMGRVSVNYQ